MIELHEAFMHLANNSSISTPSITSVSFSLN